VSVLRHPVRVAGRLVRFVATNIRGLREHAAGVRRGVPAADPLACSTWIHKYAAANLRCIGFRSECSGRVPTRGMVVCNHLGYLDVAVLAASGPMVFVSKAEVAGWPLLGSLARCGGTLFLKREQRSHVAEVATALRPIIEGGVVVAIFPEGTSSGGDSVLPFRSSLLEPAAANGWPVTPAWLTYDIDPSEGTLAGDVAYWRDMTFAPHFLNLLSKVSVVARVHYGEPVEGIRDRKELTRVLHAEVCRLRAGALRAPSV
jgi:1-acyl-sn-glycerol-3-phosphate acyltransferase